MRYHLQNCYQDANWSYLPHHKYNNYVIAVRMASKLSKNSICYGMVRVVDVFLGVATDTFMAGGGRIKW